MQKLRADLVGAQGYQRLPLSKPVVGRNVVVHAVPAYRASTYLVTAFPAHPLHFPKFLQSSTAVECVLTLSSSDSEFLLVIRLRFIPP